MPGSIICDDDHLRIKKFAALFGLLVILAVYAWAIAAASSNQTHKTTPGSVIERTQIS